MRFSLLGAAIPLFIAAVAARVVNIPTLDEEGLPVLEIVTKGAPPAVVSPKLEELTPETFSKKIGKGYWFVKHYSPRCPHCRAMAPYFDALHDIYTKAGVPESHDFHIAAVNCDAYGDICETKAYKITAYPTLNLYKDGKLLQAYDSDKRRDLPTMSDWVEEQLEKITASKKAPSTSTIKAVPVATATPAPVRNADGVSRAFDRQTFVDVVQSTRDPWFIKFYAPWCGHCQAMAPAWENLAHQMKGKLNIGEVNCDAEPRICKALKVDSYPTILFLSGGEQVVYNGLRGIGDLASYAKKAANSGLRELDAGMLDDVDASEEVYFIYFYNEATTSEDFNAIERVTLPLIGRAPLFKTASEAIAQKYRVQTFPRLLVVRDGVPTYFPHTAPKDIRDHKKIGEWMKTVWLPMVPELTAANSHEIMNGHLVVLAILSRNREKEFTAARKELKEAAAQWIEQRAQAEKAERQELRDKKELKIEEAKDHGDDKAIKEANSIQYQPKKPKKEVGFAWVDAVFWERWVRTVYGVEIERDGERVVVNEEDKKLVWEFNTKGERIPLRRTEMLEAVNHIISGTGGLKPRSTSQGWSGMVPSLHGWMFWGVVVAALAFVGLWARGKRRVGGGLGGVGGIGGHQQGGWLGLDGGEKGWLGGGSAGGPPGKYD